MLDTRHHSQRGAVDLVLIVIVALALGLGAWAGYSGMFQGGLYVSPSPTPTESASPTGTPDATAGWKTYTNTQYGFAFKYPAQFSVPAASHEVRNAFFTEAPGPSVLSYAGFQAHGNTNDKVEVGVYQVVTTDQTKVSVGNDFIPLGNDAEKVSVGGKASYEMEPFTALGSPCYLMRAYIPTGSTTIVVGMETCSTEPVTDNSIPETPSVQAVAHMHLQFGQILATFTFADSTAGWQNFSSQYFTLSFAIPDTWTVVDQPAYIKIIPKISLGNEGYEGPWMGLNRYGATRNLSRQDFIDYFNSHSDNVTQSTVVVDGNTFSRLDGTDKAIPGKKVTLILFDASGLDMAYSNDATENQILATFKFAK